MWYLCVNPRNLANAMLVNTTTKIACHPRVQSPGVARNGIDIKPWRCHWQNDGCPSQCTDNSLSRSLVASGAPRDEVGLRETGDGIAPDSLDFLRSPNYN